MAMISANLDSYCGLDSQPIINHKELISKYAKIIATYAKETVLSIGRRSHHRLAMIIRLIFKSCSGVKRVSGRGCSSMQLLSNSEISAQVLTSYSTCAKRLT